MAILTLLSGSILGAAPSPSLDMAEMGSFLKNCKERVVALLRECNTERRRQRGESVLLLQNSFVGANLFASSVSANLFCFHLLWPSR